MRHKRRKGNGDRRECSKATVNFRSGESSEQLTLASWLLLVGSCESELPQHLPVEAVYLLNCGSESLATAEAD